MMEIPVSKIDRITTRRQAKQEAGAASRSAGFYAVRGISNVLEANYAVQPAYWDGSRWHIIGWDMPVEDSPSFTVERSLSF